MDVGTEIKQLHGWTAVKPKNAKELTAQKHREALAYLMFLKRMKTGQVKGRGCADGRKQRAHNDMDDATSPSIAPEAVFLTAVIDAIEGRCVAVMDDPGAFLRADMPEDETVHVQLTGIMVDTLLEIDQEL